MAEDETLTKDLHATLKGKGDANGPGHEKTVSDKPVPAGA